jgi:transposase
LWTYNSPGNALFYDWRTSRAATCIGNVIHADFRGTIQCDGYRAYDAFARNRAVTLAGCWAHVRRKFYEAREEAPRTAAWILRQIAYLYHVEAHLRRHRAGPVLREADRAWKSRPVVAMPGRGSEALFFTRSSRTVAGKISIPMPTCATFSPACPT